MKAWVKDLSGPYNYDLINDLVAISKELDLDYALVGCGVDATHGYERTHEKAIKALFDLLVSLVGK
ncbi:hypothetical protein [uncultured Anaerococcus sp.]|uniref:hypothetical protein n=1 Tax=uncultured Anaerococcus sp. TaxID=293428 RepID=UPI00288B6A6C|nr:hypothetical protein [uncultured Anaerococcus sp.]